MSSRRPLLFFALAVACRPSERSVTRSDAGSSAAVVAQASASASAHIFDRAGPPPLRTKTVLARAQNHPKFVALSGTDVVFTAYEEGAVRKVPKSGGEAATLLEGAEDAYGIAANADVAVVATRARTGAVWRIPLRGAGKPTRIATDAFPSAVALDDDGVVWTTRDTVVRAKLDGSSRVVVARDQAGPHALVVARGVVVWTNYHGGTVASASTRGGGAVRTLASGLGNPAGVALAGEDVVVACTGDGTIRAVPRDGGPVRTLASGLSFPSEIAADDRFAYFTAASGVVGKVPLAGGAVVVLDEGQPAPTGIAVDDGAVFWADDHSGSVVALRPK